MKKYLLFLALLPQAAAAQSTAPRPWLPGEPEAPLVSPTTLARQTTSVGQLQQVLTQNYTAGVWNDQSRSLYQRYRLPTSAGWIVSQTLTGSTWNTQTRSRYQYRPNGEILTDTIDLYTTSPAGPYSAQVWTYNAQGQQQQLWSQTRNAAANRWDSTSRTQYTYSGTLKTRDLTQTYAARRFTNQNQTLYTYTGAAQIQTQETQSWNTITSSWAPSSRITYTYDSQGRFLQLTAESVMLPNPILTNYFRYTYQYNAQNRVSALIGQLWQNGTWQPYLQQLYTYDVSGNPAIVTTQNWTSSAYQNSSRSIYTYLQVSSTAAAQAAEIGLRVVPNPSRGGAASLHFAPLAAPVGGEVLDMTGRRVAGLGVPSAAAARGEVALPNALPSGMYVVVLQGNGRRWQVKWVNE